MSFRSPVRILCLTAVAAVGVSMTLLTAPTAQAAPVFADAQTQLNPFGSLDTGDIAPLGTDCTATTSGGTEPNVAVLENGAAASAATAVSGSYANAGNPADTGTGSASASGTAKITSVGGSISTMDFSAQSTAQINTALAASATCYRSVTAGVAFDFQFTVAQAGFLSLEDKNVGTSTGQVQIFRITNGTDFASVQAGGTGGKFNTEAKVYLPAGTYAGSFEGYSSVFDTTSARSGTTTVHGSFAVAGAQTEAVQGKGKKYVSAPAARSCATHTLVPTITKKKNRASDIEQITFFVNDEKVKKVKKIKKGAEVKLTVADDMTADLVAEVKLAPVRKGAPSKVIEVSASYEACS
jgi:hypothetical protein